MFNQNESASLETAQFIVLIQPFPYLSVFSPRSRQKDSVWGGVLWLGGWRRRRPQERSQLQESQTSQNRRRERGRRKREERWGGNKRYLSIFFNLFLHFHSLVFMLFDKNIILSWIILSFRLYYYYYEFIFYFIEVKEEEKVPEEEKMDTSKWENRARAYWPMLFITLAYCVCVCVCVNYVLF